MKQDNNKLYFDINDVINKMPELREEKERQLIIRIKNGDEKAKSELFCLCLKYIRKVLKKYSNHEDVFQAAAEELWKIIQNIEKYNENYGLRFLIYASKRIKHIVIKEQNKCEKVIDIPCYLKGIINKLELVTDKLNGKYGRNPTNEEIAKELNISIEALKGIIISSYQQNICDAIRINDIYEEGEYDFKDPYNDSIEDIIEEKEKMELIMQAIENVCELQIPCNRISEMDLLILKKRYGIGTQIPMTLKELGNQLGLTHQGIQQREKRAIEKLQHPIRIKQLKKLKELI